MKNRSLRQFSADLKRLPRTVAHRIAKVAAPEISALAKASFDSSSTPYGVPWEPGEDGSKVTLRKTGALERFVHYVAIGAKLRIALGVPYAKFQIGKRPVYPRQDGALPSAYSARLHAITIRIIKEDMVR